MLLAKENILKFYEKYMLLMGAAGHFIFLFQTQKIIANQSAADVSLEGFFIAFLSIISWLFYGTLKGDHVLVKVNLFGLACAILCLSTILLLG